MKSTVIKTTVSHRVPIELSDWIDEQSARLKVTKSEVVVLALEEAKAKDEVSDTEPVAA